MEQTKLKQVVSACVLAAGEPVSLDRLLAVFAPDGFEAPSRDELRAVLTELVADSAGTGIELVEVASGYRYQAAADTAQWVGRLWEERRPRYSRALLETIAIIAYRQPITRGEIESIRGVAVSTGIIKTLSDRGWVRVVGHRDVPGRPAIFATTRQFLDYFNLRSLEDLPSLAELRDLEDLNPDMFPDGPARSDDADAHAGNGGSDDAQPDAAAEQVPGTEAADDEGGHAESGAGDEESGDDEAGPSASVVGVEDSDVDPEPEPGEVSTADAGAAAEDDTEGPDVPDELPAARSVPAG